MEKNKMLPFIVPAKMILTKVVSFIKDKIVNKVSSSSTVSKLLPMAIPIALVVFIGIVVISNMDNISEKLGFDTKKTLAVKLNQEEANSNVAISANKKTQETVGIISKMSEVKDVISTKLNDEIIETIKEIDNIEKSTDKKIVKITKNTTTTDLQKKQEISKANIIAIWDSYCSFNEDSECSKEAA